MILAVFDLCVLFMCSVMNRYLAMYRGRRDTSKLDPTEHRHERIEGKVWKQKVGRMQ